MNDKLNTQDIIDALAQKHGINKKEATAFVKELFLLIEHTLEKDKIVKLKGFGTFKIIQVNARESVNVNTGERFTIQEHNKIGFVPDAGLRNLLNEPFAHFETVILENTNEKEDIPVQENIPQESKEKNEENLNKHNPTPKKKITVFITCGIGIILLAGSIILYRSLSGEGQLKKTTPPAIPIRKDTTAIPPVDTYSMEEDLRILNDTSPVNPDSVNYTITGTKTTYTIKKGETLTKVSLRFYGTKDLWPYIQKYNHTKIKNPGMITPGMILTIPELKKKDP
ncbi:DNA-binding protein HU [termite gut metagenome]|uniref:DNA-binding protein HU n=1 Tax=termite gut metagenome TaxID=433724 RepID=A0A5J4SL08_9ZZZZ